MDGPYYLRASPDGGSIYVAGFLSNAIAIFQRNVATGVLTQPASPNGCVYTGTGNANCTAAPGLTGAWHLGVSPDGATVYGVGNTGDSVAAFTRNATTGVLASVANPNACVLVGTATASCSSVQAMNLPTGMVFQC